MLERLEQTDVLLKRKLFEEKEYTLFQKNSQKLSPYQEKKNPLSRLDDLIVFTLPSQPEKGMQMT